MSTGDDIIPVSWREFEAAREAERRNVAEIAKRLDERVNAAEDKAMAANNATGELAQKHNDLIHSGEKKESTYATKDEVQRMREDVSVIRTAQAKIAGASIIGSVFLAVIINLVIRLASGS
jgi:hypothetical protein